MKPTSLPKLLLIALASLLVSHIYAHFFRFLWLTAFQLNGAQVQYIVILGCVLCTVGFWLSELRVEKLQ